MASDKPRIFHSSRDMALSLIPLVLLCLAIAGIASQCSFSPGGPKPGPVPTIDVDAVSQVDARELGFPIRKPVLPDGWQPNSAERVQVPGGSVSSRIGYVSPNGRYVEIHQSNASEDALVRKVVGESTAVGTETIGTRKWVVYGGEGEKRAWFANFGDASILIAGGATAAEFAEVAQAIGDATPLPR
ncbi:DUF4245 domain-containing protein [Antrihabitans sp. YC3-6]|uniref:DUF4245 domain-containing protein n=1 Tax=Antrihabitans stalagmiti TaxID=2799499 RepID=A0A934NW78_9NOCA|nr:DUF4245 domain-containing protein [Antrihabitans stalagmiti]MBJ8342701.1 DUF4245 domain-containing protein [Antrihabitans stalagmiti]